MRLVASLTSTATGSCSRAVSVAESTTTVSDAVLGSEAKAPTVSAVTVTPRPGTALEPLMKIVDLSNSLRRCLPMMSFLDYGVRNSSRNSASRARIAFRASASV